MRERATPVAGERYDLLSCPYCGGACPVYLDRAGRPWSRCTACNARMFGSLVGLKTGTDAGLVQVDVEWPPQHWGHRGDAER